MRGYFGIGIEGVHKAMNLGALLRSAHAFSAAFAFTVAATYERDEGNLADTSDAAGSLPFYEYPDIGRFWLPQGCQLVGVEIVEDAIDLPSFRHPINAAYVLGAERGGLSAALTGRCAHVVKIPTRFSINLSLAGSLVMYDRLISLGRHAPRPVGEGAPTEALEMPVFGEPLYKRKERLRQRKKAQAKQ